jgi:hypothetical protein
MARAVAAIIFSSDNGNLRGPQRADPLGLPVTQAGQDPGGCPEIRRGTKPMLLTVRNCRNATSSVSRLMALSCLETVGNGGITAELYAARLIRERRARGSAADQFRNCSAARRSLMRARVRFRAGFGATGVGVRVHARVALRRWHSPVLLKRWPR